jgi:hypothetical protein
MLAAPDYRSRRLAFIVGPTLARTQVMRALDRREARCFEDSWSAEAWLLVGDTAARNREGEPAAARSGRLRRFAGPAL